jgi:hypothetical protein
MFLNAQGCNFDQKLRHHLRHQIGLTVPSEPTSEKRCMKRAMEIFIFFFCNFLSFENNWNLVTLYKSVLAAEGDQSINEYGRAVLKRLKFLLKHTHGKHYCGVLFPDQLEEILQRKAALAMGMHPRLGKLSHFSRLDDALTGMIFSFSLDNVNNFASLHNRFAALYAADDWGE